MHFICSFELGAVFSKVACLSKRAEPPVDSTSEPLEACRAPGPERCNPEAVVKAKAVESVAAENRTAAVVRATGIARRSSWWRAALAEW